MGCAGWCSAICLAYLLLAVVLPLGYDLLQLDPHHVDRGFPPRVSSRSRTTTHILFRYRPAQRAIVNSLVIAVVGATVTILLCAFIAFLSQRTRLPGHKLLDTLTMIPLGFPGIVLAVGLLQAWIAPPLVLYGTIWILFVAYMTRYIPLGVRSVSASLRQIHPELEESSLSSGATGSRRSAA